MASSFSRRTLIELSAAAATGLTLAGCAATARREPRFTKGRLRHAGIGVGGMGASDLAQISSHPEVDVVALCDVDSAKLQEAAQKLSDAGRLNEVRLYRDWRELLAQEASTIDSVSVSTPDHMHAAITLAALRQGLHVYCQKPLTRTVQEARAVARAARESRAVTQMGIQNHSNAFYAQAHALFRAGHIGRVHEVHVWTDRPNNWWPQGVDRPQGSDPVPETLDWDLWLGSAPVRPYKKDNYHPFAWRGWKDFGTGAQGDMACHLMDPALWFLELDAPTRIRSDGPAPNDESYPLWSGVHYEFPANRHTTRGPLLLTWHDGGRKAPRQLLDDLEAGEVVANACLFVGEKGALLASPYETARLLPESRFKDVEFPAAEGVNHWHQWVDACRGVGEVSAPFDYSAFLTEVALLGNVALHFPHETLAWNAERMSFSDRPEATRLLSAPLREGWSVRGLG